jgi:hypothetical protein
MSVERFMQCAGYCLAVVFTTEKKPASAHKGVRLTKRVSGIFGAGKNYARLPAVRDAIASGERGEVQSLPWGEWESFPYVIRHKGEQYFRLYPVEGAVPTVTYMVDGKEVSKEVWMGFLTPSERAKMESGVCPDCITVKAGNCEFPDEG